jgi:hypothetical protein
VWQLPIRRFPVPRCILYCSSVSTGFVIRPGVEPSAGGYFVSDFVIGCTCDWNSVRHVGNPSTDALALCRAVCVSSGRSLISLSFDEMQVVLFLSGKCWQSARRLSRKQSTTRLLVNSIEEPLRGPRMLCRLTVSQSGGVGQSFILYAQGNLIIFIRAQLLAFFISSAQPSSASLFRPRIARPVMSLFY